MQVISTRMLVMKMKMILIHVILIPVQANHEDASFSLASSQFISEFQSSFHSSLPCSDAFTVDNIPEYGPILKAKIAELRHQVHLKKVYEEEILRSKIGRHSSTAYC